jgi:hypothetical protein
MSMIQAPLPQDVFKRSLSAAMLVYLAILITLTTSACGYSEASADENLVDEISSKGIQVHGDWTVTLLNSDGGIASTYEFSNSLTKTGEKVLVDLLAGTGKVGSHNIAVSFYNPEDAKANEAPAVYCDEMIPDPNNGSKTGFTKFGDHEYLTRTVFVEASVSENAHDTFTLSGICTVSLPPLLSFARVMSVGTRFNSTSFGGLGGWNGLWKPFTQKDLHAAPHSSGAQISCWLSPDKGTVEKVWGPCPMAVSSGQILAFNVKFSFE